MDSLFEALGKLLVVFKDPAHVTLLLVAVAEGYAIYRLVSFLATNYKESIQNDLRNAQALEGIQNTLEKVLTNGKP